MFVTHCKQSSLVAQSFQGTIIPKIVLLPVWESSDAISISEEPMFLDSLGDVSLLPSQYDWRN